MNNKTRKLHNFKHSLRMTNNTRPKNTARIRKYSLRNRSCNLSFYYTDDIASTPISKFKFGHSVIQTSIGPITDKSTTTKHYKNIGNCVQYKICMVQTNTTAFVSNIETFCLADGNLQIQPVGFEYKNTQGNYGLPPFPNLERLAKIYFTPLKKIK